MLFAVDYHSKAYAKKSRLKFVYNELFERIVCVRQNMCIYDSFDTTMISHISCDSSCDIFGTQYFVQFCDSSKMIHEFHVWNWFKWILKKQSSENMCLGSLKVNFLGFTTVNFVRRTWRNCPNVISFSKCIYSKFFFTILYINVEGVFDNNIKILSYVEMMKFSRWKILIRSYALLIRYRKGVW